jgi:dihydroneopterin aldolase/2-amino-4-hydroxy-6-hydroxymethyldihydropteridine diphosphokinase/dihydropteroate synthase
MGLEVTIRKPAALPFAVPGITIYRTLASYGLAGDTKKEAPSGGSGSGSGSRGEGIYVALGSNIGDRIGHIRRAVTALENRGVKVKRTSRLYESEAMYVEDQERFINGVIEVRSLFF